MKRKKNIFYDPYLKPVSKDYYDLFANDTSYNWDTHIEHSGYSGSGCAKEQHIDAVGDIHMHDLARNNSVLVTGAHHNFVNLNTTYKLGTGSFTEAQILSAISQVGTGDPSTSFTLGGRTFNKPIFFLSIANDLLTNYAFNGHFAAFTEDFQNALGTHKFEIKFNASSDLTYYLHTIEFNVEAYEPSGTAAGNKNYYYNCRVYNTFYWKGEAIYRFNIFGGGKDTDANTCYMKQVYTQAETANTGSVSESTTCTMRYPATNAFAKETGTKTRAILATDAFYFNPYDRSFTYTRPDGIVVPMSVFLNVITNGHFLLSNWFSLTSDRWDWVFMNLEFVDNSTADSKPAVTVPPATINQFGYKRTSVYTTGGVTDTNRKNYSSILNADLYTDGVFRLSNNVQLSHNEYISQAKTLTAFDYSNEGAAAPVNIPTNIVFKSPTTPANTVTVPSLTRGLLKAMFKDNDTTYVFSPNEAESEVLSQSVPNQILFRRVFANKYSTIFYSMLNLIVNFDIKCTESAFYDMQWTLDNIKVSVFYSEHDNSTNNDNTAISSINLVEPLGRIDIACAKTTVSGLDMYYPRKISIVYQQSPELAIYNRLNQNMSTSERLQRVFMPNLTLPCLPAAATMYNLYAPVWQTGLTGSSSSYVNARLHEFFFGTAETGKAAQFFNRYPQYTSAFFSSNRWVMQGIGV
jgi:hypothetical protein